MNSCVCEYKIMVFLCNDVKMCNIYELFLGFNMYIAILDKLFTPGILYIIKPIIEEKMYLKYKKR